MKILNLNNPYFEAAQRFDRTVGDEIRKMSSTSHVSVTNNMTKNKTRCNMGFFFKRFFLMVFLGVLIILACSSNVFSFIVANESDFGFIQDPPERSGDTPIRVLVMEAAGSYLVSQSDMLLVLNRIEMSEINGIDYTELQQIVNNAITHMESSRSKYLQLVNAAEITPYEDTVADALKTFSYSSFLKTNRLNEEIFEEVIAFLRTGDIRGIYREILARTDSILEKLQLIKNAVGSKVFPNIADLWEANRLFMNTLYFGQYASQIFFNVTGK
jgi:hypothetical protein